MADIGTARPFSGEMMTADFPSGRGAAVAADIIDADYIEVMPDERPTRAEAATNAAPGHAGMAMLAKNGDSVRSRERARGGPIFWTAGAVAVVASFWVAGGHAMVRDDLLFATAQKEPKLQISNVRSRAETVDGTVALVVDGDIGNEGQAAGAVPSLAVHVLSTQGAEVVYRLRTLRTPLAPSAKYSFSSRLDMPKDGVKTVSVTFDE